MSATDLSHPHDHFFRGAFGQRQVAEAYFRQHLPPALVAAGQWDRLEQQPASFTDERLRGSESDLLFTVPLSTGGELRLYLLLEHQSTADRWMPLRLLGYMVSIWKQHVERQPDCLKLPLVIPMVLSQAVGGWKPSARFEDLLDWPADPQLCAELGIMQPHFTHRLLDLAALPLQQIDGLAILRLVLGAMKARSSGRLGEWAAWVFPLWQELLAAPQAGRLLELIFRYLSTGESDLSFASLRTTLTAQPVPDKVATAIMSIAEELKTEGRRVGRVEGRVEGIRETLLCQIDSLEALLGQPVRAGSQSAGASVDELQRKLSSLEIQLKARLQKN